MAESIGVIISAFIGLLIGIHLVIKFQIRETEYWKKFSEVLALVLRGFVTVLDVINQRSEPKYFRNLMD